MNTKSSVGILILFIPLFVGCATIRGFPDPPATSKEAPPAAGFQLGDAAIVDYNRETDAAKKKLIRNEIIDARMAEIDTKFAAYERALYKEGVGWGVGTDWAVLSLTAATAIVGATTTKTALAAISTAVVGGQSAFDKRALFDKTLPALMAQMVAEREKIRAAIRGKEDTAVDAYTWFAADTDLHTFEFAGSIPGAISTISLDAGQKAATANQSLNNLAAASYVKTKAGDALRAFWKPNGKTVDDDNQKLLRDWMNANGIGGQPIEFFLRGSDFEALRAKAVKDLAVPLPN